MKIYLKVGEEKKMSKILVIAESGFGKTTSLMNIEKYGIMGINPSVSYLITATSKDLPGVGSRVKYPIARNITLQSTIESLSGTRRVISNDAAIIAKVITLLGTISKIENIILDDTNYIMQDYYMAKALSSGWDTPKKIGFDMGLIFRAVESLPPEKNFVMLAHGEEYDKVDGRKGYRMKTTGKMVQEYITPEGKFDVVLIGRSYFDDKTKTAVKQFVTNDDGFYTTAKSHEIFEDLYIPNDMGYVLEKVNKYYNGEITSQNDGN